MENSKVSTAAVLANERIAENVYKMLIATDSCGSFVPGQFINVYLNDKSTLLPRPISISDASCNGASDADSVFCKDGVSEKDSVTIVYKAVGAGTRQLAAYTTNREVRISSPLGNGYFLEKDYAGKNIALVAGGIGIPPMIGLAKALKKRNAEVDAFVGFQAWPFLTGELSEICEKVSVATDDGSFGFHGSVVDLLKVQNAVYDEYFSCGPKSMLKTLTEYTSYVKRSVQVSMEERMGCGYGACVGCACKIRESGVATIKSVCKHGPVFYGKDVVWDE